MSRIDNSGEFPDFSLVMGGPLFQLLVRSRLSTPALDLLIRRIVFFVLVSWLPLLLLSLVEGKAWGTISLPFLCDIEMHVRFLVALPLLIAAELLVHQRMRQIVGQFIDRKIVTDEVLPKFKEIIASAMQLRNSVTTELILLILVFVGGTWFWRTVSGIDDIAIGAETWLAAADPTGVHVSAAGNWYVFVSRPLFQFIMMRWYFRIFIWTRFLWQVSRLDLVLVPTHADRAAGLGFLGSATAGAFTPLLLAHGSLLAGLVANPIFFSGAKLPDFQLEIVGSVVFLLLLVFGPLLFFSPCLILAKRTGTREYGILVSRYIKEFDHKWLRGGAADDEPLIGSGDIQSLADLGNSFQVIREIKPVPFGKDTIIQVVFFALLPGLPLVLTMIPLEELVLKLLGAIF
jgi:hypothetical protein